MIFGDLGDARGIAGVLEGIAEIALDQRRWDRAFILTAAASALRQAIGAPLLPPERKRIEARLASAEAEADDRRGWVAEGQQMPVEQAIALALET